MIGLKVGLLLVSSIVALGLAEIAVRVAAGPVPGPSHHQLLCKHDPLLGWSKIPGAQRRYTTREYSIEENINSKGLRAPELPYEKPAGVTRILVLGDSFTEGYTVEFDELFTEVVAERINTPAGPRQQVINAGTGGYSTDQELLFFRSEGHKYRPDLVVLMFVYNDVWYNAKPEYGRGAKPAFELRDGELFLTNTPVPEPAAAAAPTSEPLGNRIKGAISRRSALYRLVRDRVKNDHRLHAAAIWLGLVEAPSAGSVRRTVPEEWTVFQKTRSADVQHAWTMTEALLLALREEVEAAGSSLLVVNVPTRFDLDESWWNLFKRKFGLPSDEWSPSAVTESLRALCARNGIELFDLTPDFRKAIAAGREQAQPLHFPNDGHWTPNGHRLAGELLADYFAKRPSSTEVADPGLGRPPPQPSP